jgi:hypothetical protein
VLQGQRLSDEAAHGPPKDAYALETERLDYVCGIIREASDIEWPPVVGRTADPAVIEKNHLVVRREPVDEQRIPVGTRRTESVQNQKWATIPKSPINNFRAIDFDCG